jgi:hypothetical protein
MLNASRKMLVGSMLADPFDYRIALLLLRGISRFRGTGVFREHNGIARLQGQVSTYVIVRVHTRKSLTSEKIKKAVLLTCQQSSLHHGNRR